MATHAERIALPEPVAAGRSRPPLAPRERALATERDADGAPVILSTYALYHRYGAPQDGWRRLAWEELGRVRSHGDVLELTTFTDGASWFIRLPAGARLPELVRERVAATDLIGIRIGLPDGRGALVSVRRRPATGEALFVVVLPEGVDPGDPDVSHRVDRAIHTLSTQY